MMDLHGICSCHLLTDHEANGEQRPLTVTRDGPHLSLKIHESSVADQTSLMIESFFDLTHLF